MTDPKLSFKDPQYGRFYRHPAARKQAEQTALGALIEVASPGRYAPNPSVTNIMKQHDEGFLPGYNAKLIAEFAADNLDDLVAMHDRDGVFQTLRGIPDRPHPNAAIGDEVHAAIDAQVEGRTIPPLTTITARRMFVQWLHFRETYAPKIERTEYTVWSYEHGYAGTGDLMWIKDNLRWVVDAKSGNRVYPKVAMQCAAIAKGDVILPDDPRGQEVAMPPVHRLGVMHVRPRSIKLYRLEREEEAWQAFLACKTLFDWVRYHQDRTIGDPVVKTEGAT